METERNIVGWFEIPVTDMDRAVKFYETVFGIKLERGTYEDFVLAWFPEMKNREGIGGVISALGSGKHACELV